MFSLPLSLRRTTFWAFLLAVVVLSLLPGDRLPAVFAWWDKAQHALGFALLTGLGLAAYAHTRWRLPVGLLLLGAAIEIAQGASGWRTGDWQDLLADAIGILGAWLLWRMFSMRRTATT